MRHLRSFVAVADELHFGRAAARLHIAQPPLSQQIKLLERELGITLFERSTRRVQMTSEGRALLPHARKILEEEDLAARAVRNANAGLVGAVRIGFAGTTAYGTLPRLRRAVTHSYPGIEIVLRSGLYSEKAAELVESGELDMGFVRVPTRPALDQLVVKEEPLVCALPDTHRLAGRECVNLADLADEPFVSFPATRGSAVRDLMMRVCAEAGFMPRVAVEAPDPYSILTMVAAEAGTALVLESGTHVHHEHVVFKPLDIHVQLTVALAWRRSQVSPAVQTVVGVARSIVGLD